MIDLIQGIFISLLVGLIILIIQFINNKKKELFFTITYCENVLSVLKYNKQVSKYTDEVYNKYFNYINHHLEFNPNTNYSCLNEYLNISYYKLLTLPKIQPNVINMKFLDFFLDYSNTAEKLTIYSNLLLKNNEETKKFEEEQKTALGTYRSLYGCILKFNENLLKINNL